MAGLMHSACQLTTTITTNAIVTITNLAPSQATKPAPSPTPTPSSSPLPSPPPSTIAASTVTTTTTNNNNHPFHFHHVLPHSPITVTDRIIGTMRTIITTIINKITQHELFHITPVLKRKRREYTFANSGLNEWIPYFENRVFWVNAEQHSMF